ncbi:MAG: cation diffusion facilitator family transporter [Gammaproteobacteria bacterium]|nr:cation diffusion facilitator family transporter [Gammaproteobacteria bacterium]NNF60938.1 cation transporter [Gammaproteobacteria bacterium]NNM20845.1 cation transporter [Gammaproteobacteria bacterium]
MHGHSHDYGRAFALGVALNIVFVVIEAVFGFLSGSLALLADAGHNLGDVMALLLAWGALAISRRQPSGRRTYGYRRATILAAVASGVLLLVAIGGIVWEAAGRLLDAQPVDGMTVIVVAAIGVVINFFTAMLFHRGREHDLNIRSAWLHMAADAAVSLGVVLAGVLILVTGSLWIDPALSLVIAAVILVATWRLLRESVDMAVDAVPRHIDPAEVRRYLLGRSGVNDVHDLHIWAMSTTETALTAHLVMPGAATDSFLQDVTTGLGRRFRIQHATLQVERGDAGVRCAPCEPGQRLSA